MLCCYKANAQLQHNRLNIAYLNSKFPILSCFFVIWMRRKTCLHALLLQKMFNSSEDNGDASVYEVMRTAGE